MFEAMVSDEEGTKYFVTASVSNGGIKISRIQRILKGKRKKVDVVDLNCDYQYRTLSMSDRKVYALNKVLEVVPEHLLFEALEDIWRQFKPKNIELLGGF